MKSTQNKLNALAAIPAVMTGETKSAITALLVTFVREENVGVFLAGDVAGE